MSADDLIMPTSIDNHAPLHSAIHVVDINSLKKHYGAATRTPESASSPDTLKQRRTRKSASSREALKQKLKQALYEIDASLLEKSSGTVAERKVALNNEKERWGEAFKEYQQKIGGNPQHAQDVIIAGYAFVKINQILTRVQNAEQLDNAAGIIKPLCRLIADVIAEKPLPIQDSWTNEDRDWLRLERVGLLSRVAYVADARIHQANAWTNNQESLELLNDSWSYVSGKHFRALGLYSLINAGSDPHASGGNLKAKETQIRALIPVPKQPESRWEALNSEISALETERRERSDEIFKSVSSTAGTIATQLVLVGAVVGACDGKSIYLCHHLWAPVFSACITLAASAGGIYAASSTLGIKNAMAKLLENGDVRYREPLSRFTEAFQNDHEAVVEHAKNTNAVKVAKKDEEAILLQELGKMNDPPLLISINGPQKIAQNDDYSRKIAEIDAFIKGAESVGYEAHKLDEEDLTQDDKTKREESRKQVGELRQDARKFHALMRERNIKIANNGADACGFIFAAIWAGFNRNEACAPKDVSGASNVSTSACLSSYAAVAGASIKALSCLTMAVLAYRDDSARKHATSWYEKLQTNALKDGKHDDDQIAVMAQALKETRPSSRLPVRRLPMRWTFNQKDEAKKLKKLLGVTHPEHDKNR